MYIICITLLLFYPEVGVLNGISTNLWVEEEGEVLSHPFHQSPPPWRHRDRHQAHQGHNDGRNDRDNNGGQNYHVVNTRNRFAPLTNDTGEQASGSVGGRNTFYPSQSQQTAENRFGRDFQLASRGRNK